MTRKKGERKGEDKKRRKERKKERKKKDEIKKKIRKKEGKKEKERKKKRNISSTHISCFTSVCPFVRLLYRRQNQPKSCPLFFLVLIN